MPDTTIPHGGLRERLSDKLLAGGVEIADSAVLWLSWRLRPRTMGHGGHA